MRIQDLTEITPDLRAFGLQHVSEAIAHQKSKNAGQSTGLYIWRTQKSCPKCLKLYSEKDGVMYCPTHQDETRLLKTVELEARIFRFIQEAVMERGRAGINVYRCRVSDGEPLSTMKIWNLAQLETPEDGGRVVFAIAKDLLDRSGVDSSQLFEMVALKDKDPLPRLRDGADVAQVASALNATLDQLNTGVHAYSNMAFYKLISEYEVIDNHLQALNK